MTDSDLNDTEETPIAEFCRYEQILSVLAHVEFNRARAMSEVIELRVSIAELTAERDRLLAESGERLDTIQYVRSELWRRLGVIDKTRDLSEGSQGERELQSLKALFAAIGVGLPHFDAPRDEHA